jgi:hypothetical protein
MFWPMLAIVAVEWLSLLLALVVANADPAGITAAFAALVPLMVRVTTSGLGVALGAAIIADALAGEPVSARTAIRTSRPFGKELLAAALLGALLAMIFVFLSQGLTLLLLPLFYGPPLVAQVIVLEAKPFQLATGRVREIGRGHLARMFGYLTAVALFMGLVGVVIPRVIASLVAGLGDAGQLALLVSTSMVLSAIALAFFSAVTTVAYFDLRARAENYGLEELRAERGSAAT